jgi:tetratricopeptide (TPR) repeat protein
LISLLFALAAQAPAAQALTPQSCAAAAKATPDKAIELASDWRLKGGGLDARQCLGLAYSQLGRWAPAATSFEQAASEAEISKDSRRAEFLVQAGNAWLAAKDPAKARKAFDAALATGIASPELQGEAYLDRARALVALGDAAGGRADLDKGLGLVPGDPFGWYLSAALAQREGNLARAKSDIQKAVAGAPDDADVLLLAGNVAGLSGEFDAARNFFTRAARAAPDSASGKAAAAALAANAEPEAPPPQAQPKTK